MSLSAEDIGYVYGAGSSFAVTALDGVSLNVEPGGLLLVLGKTGSGKSTLLRLLAGLTDPRTGSVTADGDALTSSAARGCVGMVFQDPESQLFADSVLEDVEFGPRNLGRTAAEARADAEWALADVGLPAEAFGERSPFSLSGGEARRAALAGVLAMRPRYLLLDEPTAGLDAPGRRAVAEAVSAARAGGVGAVVVSHEVEEWLGRADDVLVLDAGAPALLERAETVVREPGLLSRVGMRPPEVLRAWDLARERGLDAGPATLDPAALGAALAAGRSA